jgi:glyceraldehyde 3-phosphate dehydrogenase
LLVQEQLSLPWVTIVLTFRSPELPGPAYSTEREPRMGKRAGRIGLMGLGRIGRNLFRLLAESEDLELAAATDPSDPAALLYLLRFDSLLGRFPHPLALEGGELAAAGRRVRLLPAAAPGEVPWGELGVETVIDTGPRPATRAAVEGHLAAGARRVILCAQPVEPADVTVVMGINDGALQPGQRMIYGASASAGAAAVAVATLEEAFGIRRGFATFVRAYGDQQSLADVPADDARRGRAAAENIIPQQTAEAAVLTELLPGLRGKLSAFAMNVPVAHGSAVDLVCWHERPVTVEEVNRVMREAAAGRLAGILDYEDSPIVSSDVLRSAASGICDSLATMVLAGNVSKTLTWYDDGWGYAHRLLDVVRRFQTLDAAATRDSTEPSR